MDEEQEKKIIEFVNISENGVNEATMIMAKTLIMASQPLYSLFDEAKKTDQRIHRSLVECFIFSTLMDRFEIDEGLDILKRLREKIIKMDGILNK